MGAIALDRIRGGRAARSFLLCGVQGVGTTVLLRRIRTDAEARGLRGLRSRRPKSDRFWACLRLRQRSARCCCDSSRRGSKGKRKKALRFLADFAKTLRVKYQDIEVGLDFEPDSGIADSGDLDRSRARELDPLTSDDKH
ncbi:MAG: hypothetical protein Q8R02_19510 [Hyphomonadaceae bacterium]|nr:hypothetical protein [Hyphomonadaceae bacterium]